MIKLSRRVFVRGLAAQVPFLGISLVAGPAMSSDISSRTGISIISSANFWVFRGVEDFSESKAAVNAYVAGDTKTFNREVEFHSDKTWANYLNAIAADRGFGQEQDLNESTNQLTRIAISTDSAFAGSAALIAAANLRDGITLESELQDDVNADLLLSVAAGLSVPDALDFQATQQYSNSRDPHPTGWADAYQILLERLNGEASEFSGSDPHLVHLAAHMLSRGITPSFARYEGKNWPAYLHANADEVEASPLLTAYQLFEQNGKRYGPSAWGQAKLISTCFSSDDNAGARHTISQMASKPKVIDRFRESIIRAAELNYPRAYEQLGLYYEVTDNPTRARIAYLNGAQYGDPDSYEKAAKMILKSPDTKASLSAQVDGLTMFELTKASRDESDAIAWADEVSWGFQPEAYEAAQRISANWKVTTYDFDAWTLHSGFGPSGWRLASTNSDVWGPNGNNLDYKQECTKVEEYILNN